MFKWLKNIFIKPIEPKCDKDITPTTMQQNNTQPIIKKEFELAVYDVVINDSTGKEEYRRVSYEEPVTVTACSQAELNTKLQLFKSCGQIAKVTRVIRETTINDKSNITEPKASDNQHNGNLTALSCETVSHDQDSNRNCNSLATLMQKQSPVETKPLYFKIGDIEIKNDNGKIYQKQWMRLTEAEASNFRLINDKSNSIVNLNGKHIEIKKWCLVEQNDNAIDNLTTLD